MDFVRGFPFIVGVQNLVEIMGVNKLKTVPSVVVILVTICASEVE